MSLVATPDPNAPPAAADPNAPPAAADPNAAPAAAVAPVRPEGLSDAYWDDTAGVKPEAYARLVELETAEAARASAVPADGKYELKVTDGILDLEGKPVTINAEDPLAKGLLAKAKDLGLPQNAVTELVSLYAAAEVEAAKAMQVEQAAELAKLGTGAQARIDAYSAALKQHAGPSAQALIDSIGSADAVLAVEALLKSLAGPKIETPPHQQTPNPFEGLSGEALLTAARAAQAAR